MRWLVVLTLVAGCYRPPANEFDADVTNADADASDVDANDNGTIDAALEIDACAAPACVGETLRTCTGDTVCTLGCIAPPQGQAHCARMVASNGVTETEWQLALDSNDIIYSGDVEFDTMTGAISRGPVQIRPAGEGLLAGVGWKMVGTLSVFTFRSLRVNESMSFTGRNPVVFVVHDTVTIGGEIDLGGFGVSDAGPGGSLGGKNPSEDGTGCGPGGGGENDIDSGNDAGGGGGGFGTQGAAGGLATGAVAGAAGLICSNDTLEPLIGGSGGGTGSFARQPEEALQGGGGGGALQISSRNSIVIAAGGIITAPGGGGHGGRVVSQRGSAGGGGGSGGGILLEAPMVVNQGGLFANGGGGGSGAAAGGTPGNPGEQGKPSLIAARGGGGTTRGGRGAVDNLAATAGESGEPNAGGGGGGLGRIVIRGNNPTAGMNSPPARLLALKLE